MVSAGWYSAGIETPANAKFVEAIRAKYDADPGYYTVGAYMACEFLADALERTGGKTDDRQALIDALRAVDIQESPYGAVKVDAYGQPVMDIQIRRVEEKDGRLQNTVIKTYPAVSQFWTYDPKAFLASPVYSREDPAPIASAN